MDAEEKRPPKAKAGIEGSIIAIAPQSRTLKGFGIPPMTYSTPLGPPGLSHLFLLYPITYAHLLLLPLLRLLPISTKQHKHLIPPLPQLPTPKHRSLNQTAPLLLRIRTHH
jgi:hypothetical protein